MHRDQVRRFVVRSFNGAAVLGLRRRNTMPARLLAEFGTWRFNGAAVLGLRRRADRTAVLLTRKTLQWSRSLRTAETRLVREEYDRFVVSLQWSRSLRTAETHDGIDPGERVLAASMEPQS